MSKVLLYRSLLRLEFDSSKITFKGKIGVYPRETPLGLAPFPACEYKPIVKVPGSDEHTSLFEAIKSFVVQTPLKSEI
jgi:hypothetical protein